MQEWKKIGNAIPQKTVKTSKIGLNGLEFSKRILDKYAFFRKSGRLSILIFLNLFGRRTEIGGKMPYHSTSPIINYFRFHLNFYFGVIRQSRSSSIGNPSRHIYTFINSGKARSQLLINKSLTQISYIEKDIGSRDYTTGSMCDPALKSSGYFRTGSAVKKLFDHLSEFNYLDILHSLTAHMRFKSLKVSNSSSYRQNRAIEKISYENMPEEYGANGTERFFPLSYLITRPAKIMLNALLPKNSGYQQSSFNVEDAGSANYRIGIDAGFSEFSPLISMRAYPEVNQARSQRTASSPFQQNRIIQNMKYEYFPGEHGTTGTERFFQLSHLITRPAEIMLNALHSKDSGYQQSSFNVEDAGSANYRIIQNIKYLYFPGEGIGYTGHYPLNHLMTRQTKLSLNSLNPATVRHLQEAFNVTEADSMYTIALSSGLAQSDREMISLDAKTLKLIEGRSVGRSAASGKARSFTTRLNRTNQNTSLSKINLISTASPAISPFQRVPSTYNPGSIYYSATLPEFQPIIREGLHLTPLSLETSREAPITGKKAFMIGSDSSSGQIKIRSIYNENILLEEVNGKTSPVKIVHDWKSLSAHANIFSERSFAINRINFQYADALHKKMYHADLAVDNTYNSELVLEKPAIQQTETNARKRDNLMAEKAGSTKMNDDVIKGSSKEKSVPELSIIADRVYRLIEKKISIEKDRRGLL